MFKRIGAQKRAHELKCLCAWCAFAPDYDDHCANKIDGVHHLRAQFDRHSKSRRGDSALDAVVGESINYKRMWNANIQGYMFCKKKSYENSAQAKLLSSI